MRFVLSLLIFSFAFVCSNVQATVHVLVEEEGNPVSGIRVEAHLADGTPLGNSEFTDMNGVAAFSYSTGSYRFRVYEHSVNWFSQPVSAPGSTVLTMPVVTRFDLQYPGNESNHHIRPYLVDGEELVWLGYTRETNEDGIADFRLEPGEYQFRFSWNGYAHFSAPVTAGETGRISIPGETEIFVATGERPENGMLVEIYDEQMQKINYSKTTGVDGKVSFSLVEGNWIAQVSHQGDLFQSQLFAAGTTGIVSLGTLVQVESVELPTQFWIRAYEEDGAYTGLNILSSVSGDAVFPLYQGLRKYRISHNGRAFFSPLYPSGSTARIALPDPTYLKILHENSPVDGLQVEAYDLQREKLNYSRVTDSAGDVIFHVTEPTIFRVTQAGDDWYSFPVFPGESEILRTGVGSSGVTVNITGDIDLSQGEWVRSYYPDGIYAEDNRQSDTQGHVFFPYSSGFYKFRVSYNGREFFSEVSSVPSVVELTIPQGTVLHVAQGGVPVSGIKVESYSSELIKMDYSRNLDMNGYAKFHLGDSENQGPWIFRVSLEGEDYFSPPVYQGEVKEWDLLDSEEPWFPQKRAFVSESLARIPLSVNFSNPVTVNTLVSVFWDTLQGAKRENLSSGTLDLEVSEGEFKVETEIPFFANRTFESSQVLQFHISGLSSENSTQEIIIVDDDPEPVIQFRQRTSEVSESQTTGLVEISLSGSTAETATVRYAARGPGAFAGGISPDISFQTDGELIFHPGEHFKMVPWLITDDATEEGDEKSGFYLYSPENALIGRKDFHVLTILDNDRSEQPSFVVSGEISWEGQANTQPVTMVVVDHASLSPFLIETEVLSQFEFALPSISGGYDIHAILVRNGVPRIQSEFSINSGQEISFDFTLEGDAGRYGLYLNDSELPHSDEIRVFHLISESFQPIGYVINNLGPFFPIPEVSGEFYLALQDGNEWLYWPKLEQPHPMIRFNRGKPIHVILENSEGPLPQTSVYWFDAESQEFVQSRMTNIRGEMSFPSLVERAYIAFWYSEDGLQASEPLFSGDTYSFLSRSKVSGIESAVRVTYQGGAFGGAPLRVRFFDDDFKPVSPYTPLDADSYTRLPESYGLYHLGIEDRNNFLLSSQYVFPSGELTFDIGGDASVHVIDKNGNVNDADISYWSSSVPEFIQTGKTDEGGNFGFLTLSDEFYTVEVTSQGQTVVVSQIIAENPVDIYVPSGEGESSFILVENSTPVVAPFEIVLLDSSSSAISHVVSSVDGIATTSSALGEFLIGWKRPDSSRIALKESPVILPMQDYELQKGKDIQLKVSDGKYPVSQISIQFSPENIPQFVQTGITDASGAFVIPTVGNEGVSIRVVFESSIEEFIANPGEIKQVRMPPFEGQSRIQILDHLGGPASGIIQILDENGQELISKSLDDYGQTIFGGITGSGYIRFDDVDGASFLSGAVSFPAEDYLLKIGIPVDISLEMDGIPASGVEVSCIIDGFSGERTVYSEFFTSASGTGQCNLFSGQSVGIMYQHSGLMYEALNLYSGSAYQSILPLKTVAFYSESSSGFLTDFLVHEFAANGDYLGSASSIPFQTAVELRSEAQFISVTGENGLDYWADMSSKNPGLNILNLSPPVTVQAVHNSGPETNILIEVFLSGSNHFMGSKYTDLNGNAEFGAIQDAPIVAVANRTFGQQYSRKLEGGDVYVFNPSPISSLTLSRDGQTLQGLQIDLYSDNGTIWVTGGVADSTGTAWFAGLNQSLRLRISDSSDIVWGPELRFPLEGESIELGRIQLTASESSSVQAGLPTTMSISGESHMFVTSATNEAGIASWQCVEGVDYDLQIENPYSSQSLYFQHCPTQAEINWQGHVVHVSDEYEPLEGAVVGLSSEIPGPLLRTASTNASGYASFPFLAGDFWLSLYREEVQLLSRMVSEGQTSAIQLGSSVTIGSFGALGPRTGDEITFYRSGFPEVAATRSVGANGWVTFPALAGVLYEASRQAYGEIEVLQDLEPGNTREFSRLSPGEILILNQGVPVTAPASLQLVNPGLDPLDISCNLDSQGSCILSYDQGFRVLLHGAEFQLPQLSKSLPGYISSTLALDLASDFENAGIWKAPEVLEWRPGSTIQTPAQTLYVDGLVDDFELVTVTSQGINFSLTDYHFGFESVLDDGFQSTDIVDVRLSRGPTLVTTLRVQRNAGCAEVSFSPSPGTTLDDYFLTVQLERNTPNIGLRDFYLEYENDATRAGGTASFVSETEFQIEDMRLSGHPFSLVAEYEDSCRYTTTYSVENIEPVSLAVVGISHQRYFPVDTPYRKSRRPVITFLTNKPLYARLRLWLEGFEPRTNGAKLVQRPEFLYLDTAGEHVYELDFPLHIVPQKAKFTVDIIGEETFSGSDEDDFLPVPGHHEIEVYY